MGPIFFCCSHKEPAPHTLYFPERREKKKKGKYVGWILGMLGFITWTLLLLYIYIMISPPSPCDGPIHAGAVKLRSIMLSLHEKIITSLVKIINNCFGANPYRYRELRVHHCSESMWLPPSSLGRGGGGLSSSSSSNSRLKTRTCIDIVDDSASQRVHKIFSSYIT